MQAIVVASGAKLSLNSATYLLRTMEMADAELAWGRWTENPTTARLLNTTARAMTVTERRAYIAAFDSRSSYLLGIWEQSSNDLVGFWSIYVDQQRKEFLLNVLVGSSDRRHKGAIKETRHLIYQHFFEGLGMESVRCSVTGQNHQMIAFLLEHRWVREGASRKPAASGSGAVDIHHFRLTRDIWRARRAEDELTQSKD